MAAQIRTAVSSSELHDVYRLRYEVYAEELHRVQAYADHERRVIEEPLDRGALLYVAYEGARLVGTVRVNYTASSEIGDYASIYEMSRVGAGHPNHTSVTTKMIVAPDYRNTTLAYRLAVAGYTRMLEDGILHDFIDVYPARIPFFEKLGYRLHVAGAHHAEFGDVTVMRLDVRDVDHLCRVGSPFARYVARYAKVA
jgi:hypothetical protein